jgi:hypothetical protein
MKLSLFLIAILVTGLSWSQEIIPNFKKGKSRVVYPRYDAYSKDSLDHLPLVIIPGSTPEGKFQHTLPNGNIVYALPQDNMPCIVPNESLSIPIPNISGNPGIPYSYKGPGAIPNPAVPIQINPKKKIQKK